MLQSLTVWKLMIKGTVCAGHFMDYNTKCYRNPLSCAHCSFTCYIFF